MRRLKSTSLGVHRSEAERILIEYMDNMAGMGYSWEYREKVMRAAMTGYIRILTHTKLGQTLRKRTGIMQEREGWKEKKKRRRWKKRIHIRGEERKY